MQLPKSGMLTETDKQIIIALRRNARQSLIGIARQTDIPMSTLHDKIRTLRGMAIERFTILINFTGMGYPLHIQLMIKGRSQELRKYLEQNPAINNLCHLGGGHEGRGHDYSAECVFRSLKEMDKFLEDLDKLVEARQLHYITETIRRESLFTAMIPHISEQQDKGGLELTGQG